MSAAHRDTPRSERSASTSGLASELSIVSAAAKRSPVLSREQELELIRRIRDSGDRAAADALARAHLRLVIALALKFRHYGVPVSELVAEGNAGLLTAMAKFDPERGTRLATYANYWVRAKMLAHVIQVSSASGGGSGALQSRLFFKVRRERARVYTLLGEGAASAEALAKRLNLSPTRVQGMLERLDFRRLSLDADTLMSSDDPEQSYFEEQRRLIFTSAVGHALGLLDPRERFIVEHRMMAFDSDELSLAELGRMLGISRERARQLEERAKGKLRGCPEIQRNVRLNEWCSEYQQKREQRGA